MFFRRLIDFEPRKPVPWGFFDLVVLFFLYVFTMVAAIVFVQQSGVHLCFTETPIADSAFQSGLLEEHPLAQLMVLGRENAGLFWILFLTAAIFVPIGEEFTYRLLIQGYAEKKEPAWRKALRKYGLSVPRRGVLALVMASMLFASQHFRTHFYDGEEKPPTFYEMLISMIAIGWGYVLFVFFAVAYLFLVRGANGKDLGWEWRKIPGDCLLGTIAAIFCIPPIYLLQVVLSGIFAGSKIAPDPIPIFFLALVLGGLYFRTHRILPSIVLHAILNGFTLLWVYFVFSRG